MSVWVYLLSIAAAAVLGVGWVLQHQVASGQSSRGQSGWQNLLRSIRRWEWWAGIALMATGQSLAAWALQEGTLVVVEPALSSCLLFALLFGVVRERERLRPFELLGVLVLALGIAVFLFAAHPRKGSATAPGWLTSAAVAGTVAAIAAVVTVSAHVLGRYSDAGRAVAYSAAAGMLYALQDAATRGAFLAIPADGLFGLFRTSWPYVLLAAAAAAVLLSQAAFRSARLDWALPPTVALQALAGVALGVSLLGSSLSRTPAALVGEAIGAALCITGVAAVGRSPVFRRLSRRAVAESRS